MLTPHEIQALSEDLIRLYVAVEDDLLINIAKRFNDLDYIDDSAIAAWQMDKLQQLGALRKDNIKAIKRYSNRTAKEIESIISKGGYKALELDEMIYKRAFAEGMLINMPLPIHASPQIQQIIQGAMDNTKSYFNLINTTALESADSEFLRIINQTYLETSLGVTDYNTSIRKAVRQLSDKGITGATYISARGRHTRNQLDVAVRRAILTSTSQTSGRMQIQRARDWGSNLVEVSSHLGARPSHAEWQGKIYSLDGGTAQYPNLVQATDYGSVTGLKGANCGHQFYPFFEGISEQTYYPYEKKLNAEVYEQSQEQRKCERGIREAKRRVLTADTMGDKEALLQSQLLLKEREQKLNGLLADTGRTKRSNRQQVMDFGRSEASKAVWAKRKNK